MDVRHTRMSPEIAIRFMESPQKIASILGQLERKNPTFLVEEQSIKQAVRLMAASHCCKQALSIYRVGIWDVYPGRVDFGTVKATPGSGYFETIFGIIPLANCPPFSRSRRAFSSFRLFWRLHFQNVRHCVLEWQRFEAAIRSWQQRAILQSCWEPGSIR